MPIVRVDPQHPDPAALAPAAAALRAGELVAFPTETVYGLGAAALDERAVARIYAAKRRPSQHPLIVHVLEPADARALAREWPRLADELTAAFWPGPLTLVVPKRSQVPDLVTAGLASVALRAPAHPVARALLAAAAIPVAAPSANRYQSVSPTTAAHVERSLGLAAIAWLIDGGPTSVGIESTVVDLSGPRPRLLRPGGLEAGAIEAITGPLDRLDPTRHAIDDDQAHPSPGMAARHYSPSASVELLVRARLSERANQGPRPVGAILRGGASELAGIDHPLELPDDPREYARLLYAALHTLDELGCARILIEALPDTPAWAALRDRLQRASTPA
ncbi:L-threonylcarbamoyladenylate synthase [Nannocystaceae bacterium ST9]